MNNLKRKLQSNRGASMILALVFLLFSVFVGGSVLAVATANSARIQHQTDTQQQFLRQRSAVRLMQDAMTDGTQPTVRLSVNIITTTTQKVELLDGGGLRPIGTPTQDIRFTFTGYNNGGNKPAVQRLIYESAIYRVMNIYDHVPASGLSLTNLTFVTADGRSAQALSYVINGSNNFWLTGADSNTIQITDPTGAPIDAWIICEGGTDPYNFWITFGENGRDAQVSLQMNATVSQRPRQQGAPSYEDDPDQREERYQLQKTVSTESIIITWATPEIVKGGID